MNKPVFDENNVELLFDGRFVRVYDLKYAPGRHYYDASRHELKDLTCFKSDEEFKRMIPDAVTISVIIEYQGEKKLLLSYEYRYPTGQFLLSPVAGLIDKEDLDKEDVLFETAKRELFEETGLSFKEGDEISVLSNCLFSTPGMSDESNAMIRMLIHVDDLSVLNQSGAQGSELFDGFALLGLDEAKKILKEGKDASGNYFSIFTYAVLSSFVLESLM